MTLDDQTRYRALLARDVRFDGLFFVGVTTTGIYCRPVCTARTPGRDRCRFFPNAALAEREGFRPCLRCRPELAPGAAPVDAVANMARRAASRIEAGALNGGGSLEQLAQELAISSRQLRRAIQREFGVSPVELAQTNRLLLAKRLLGESNLPMIDVALASGFSSVRRFNALFRHHYGFPPSRIRRSQGAGLPQAVNSNGTLQTTKSATSVSLRAAPQRTAESRCRSLGQCIARSPVCETECADRRDSLRLTLAYRPPYAWREMLRFLAGRATLGVERVGDGEYSRTVAIDGRCGWLSVGPIEGRNALAVELSTSLVGSLPAILVRLRNLFDLSARPDVIESHLAADAALAPSIRGAPGLRVPGTFDGFELAVRAILGQRVSVAAATTLSGRLASVFGEAIVTPFVDLNRLAPAPARLAAAGIGAMTKLGIAAPRASCIRDLARAVAHGEISLEAGAEPETVIARLVTLRGIGDWTAHYIALRALRWPDAFPAGDLGLLRRAGAKSTAALRRAAEAWRPWRAYAAMHLWNDCKPNGP